MKIFDRIPTWGWYLLAGFAALVLIHRYALPRSNSNRNTVAGAEHEGLSPEVAAALSGHPSTNAAPADSLAQHVLDALGQEYSALDTIGTRLLRSSGGVTFRTADTTFIGSYPGATNS